MSAQDELSIEWAELSDVGRQRSTNQDFCGAAILPSGERLWIVADGMGGHAGGEIASRVAVEAATASFVAGRGTLPERLRAAVAAANRAVIATARGDRALTGMGTTAVAIALGTGTGACVANVGDSRAYRVRRGRIEQLTRDHSVVAELVRQGAITEEEALIHPRRHEVLRSLGFEDDLDVDVDPLDVAAGDVLLLCTDGLTGVVDDAEISALCGRRPQREVARALVDAANARGGPDNITVQVIRLSR